MTRAISTLRDHLHTIVRAGIDAASAGGALTRALADPDIHRTLDSGRVHVVAAGKAAASMARVFAASRTHAQMLAAGTHCSVDLPTQIEWHEASHPLPDARSVAAGRRALAIARAAHAGDVLLLLLSGGASALLALPRSEITLHDKRATIALMMNAGADIHALNTVRKHLSALKGGQLAAACAGQTLTLAVSDVIGDDADVIGSGPGVPDPTTWADAEEFIARFGGAEHPESVRSIVARGRMGDVPDTPKPHDPRLARAQAKIIASRADAMAGARRTAERLGYRVVMFDDAIAGEARIAARIWFDRVMVAASTDAPTCVVSAGETTVRVVGSGKGGRNQEFALSLAETVAQLDRPAALASVGTDGIDGPTDAAGAVVDPTTRARAVAAGLDPHRFLDANDSYAFFDRLGDLIRSGRTDTNVGDLQICVLGSPN